ncbi:hypothetical protein [Streptomyces sp. NPDC057877]|uniref:hypothetical protein n=1 Tax=Streptomyces sp. NPDC057877 TaxID=3346269 RepID=UPI003673B0EF
MRTTAIATALVTSSVVLAGCGDDSEPESGQPAASASASGGGEGTQERGTAAVRTAYEKTAEAETAKLTIRATVNAGGETVTTNGRGALDLADGDSTMTVSAPGQSVEQRVVDRTLYQREPGQKASDKPWVKIDLDKVAEQQGANPQEIGDPARSAAYAKAITDKDVSKVGTERIDGVNTTTYKVAVDVAELPGGSELREQVGPTLPMRVWLDDDGRIRRQQLAMTLQAPASAQPDSASPQRMKVDTVLEFTDFGTEVDVTAPPAGKVTDVTDQVLKDGQRQS